jgi:RNA polymerase sigma-70 factor (ECF subfamily)
MGAANEQLDVLYRTYAPVVFRRSRALLGNEADALDAVQDIFVNLRDKLSTFRGEASLMTWIYRVTTNHCLNRLRAERARRRMLDGVRANPRDGAVRPAAESERRDLLHKLLSELSERQVQVAIHLYYDEMSQGEVASLLNISARAVRKIATRVHERVGEAARALAVQAGEGA